MIGRQTVQDSEGLTPIAFAPGYLDSVGRAVVHRPQSFE
jgi:hypothetical protein